MAKYFFNLHECGRVVGDEEGSDHADLAKARGAAIKAVREIMCAEVSEGRLCLSCRLAVTDSSGAEIFAIPFREALTISGL